MQSNKTTQNSTGIIETPTTDTSSNHKLELHEHAHQQHDKQKTTQRKRSSGKIDASVDSESSNNIYAVSQQTSPNATEYRIPSNGLDVNTVSDVVHTSTTTNKIPITREDMKKYFRCPQGLAARLLGVSVSTLKRRFYELNLGRWPYQSMTTEERKRQIYFVVNETEPEDAKYLGNETMTALQNAFSNSINPQHEQQANTKKRKTDFQFLSYVPSTDSSSLRQRYNRLDTASSVTNDEATPRGALEDNNLNMINSHDEHKHYQPFGTAQVLRTSSQHQPPYEYLSNTRYDPRDRDYHQDR